MTTTATAGPSDPTAVVGRRFLAAAIDLGVLWAFSATFWLLSSRRVPSAVADRFGTCTGQSFCTELGDRYVSGWPLALLLVVAVAYLVGVFVVQRGLTGRTLGTMLTGVVVVGHDGLPLGVGRAALRSAAGVVDYLPCCLPVVGVATVLITPGHRRVGDMAAESNVVGWQSYGEPVVVPDASPSAPVTPTAPVAMPLRPPTPDAGRPPAPTSPPAPPAPAAGPIWDQERRAYVQWDPDRGRWLQFDQVSQRWQSYDDATGRWGPLAD